MKKITSTTKIIILGVVGLFLVICAGLLYKYSNYSSVLEAASDAYELLFLGLTTLFFLILLLLEQRKNIYLKLLAVLVIIGLFLCQLYLSAVAAIALSGGEGWFLLSFVPAIVFLFLDFIIVKNIISKSPKLEVKTLTISYIVSAVPIILFLFALFSIPSKPYDNILVNIKNALGISIQNATTGAIGLPFKEKPISLIPFGRDEDFMPGTPIDTFTWPAIRFYWDREVDIYSSSAGTVKEVRDYNIYKNYSFSIEGNNTTIFYGKLSFLNPQIKQGEKVEKGQLLGKAKMLYWTLTNKQSNNKFEDYDTVSCPADHLRAGDRDLLKNIPLKENYAGQFGNGDICQ